AYAAGGTSISLFARYSPASNSWTSLPSLPNGGQGPLAVYAGGKVYVFGGKLNNGTGLNFTRIYDIASNSWGYGAAMPDTRLEMAGGYWNGKIYVVGGYANYAVGSAKTTTWEYDIASNTWNTSR